MYAFNQLPPIDYFGQLIQYHHSQLDYYRYSTELQHCQHQNLQLQHLRHLEAAKAMTQFNESFDKNFPQFKQTKLFGHNLVGIGSSSLSQQFLNPTVNHVLENYETKDCEETPQDLCKSQILSLNCLFTLCSEEFSDETKLDQHLQVKHRTFPFRCFHKNCDQSFSNSQMQNRHFQAVHQYLNNWDCGKCVRTYQSHTRLHSHHRNYHQSGKFKCSYPECAFIGQYRSDVYTHYEQHHQTYRCDHPDCGKSFRKTVHLKTHQRIHLGIKPFKCKWSGCLYASEDRSNAIKHIRIKHLKLPITKKEQQNKKIEDHRNPKQYLEVVKSLL